MQSDIEGIRANRVVFTVGHSTHTIEAFVDMLQSFDVNAVVDIRTVPRSRTNPRYNLDVLPELLAQFDIAHYQIAALGGLRKKSKTVPDEVNGFWDNRSFHNYADYALSEEFEAGLSRLLELGDNHRCAIMCSEAVWWRCHRRIVADYLLIRGVEVVHIMGPGKSSEATITPGARVGGLRVTYPRPQPS